MTEMNLKEACKDFLTSRVGPGSNQRAFLGVIVWSSITSSLRHPHLGQERSEEEW